MPERAAYDEAIRLSQARLKVQDPELTEGAVEKFTVQTTVGAMERPWGLEGGFAVVYKFSTRSGNLLALRCFRVSMSPDTQFRYERIGPYFATNIPTISASFKYHEKGIIVKETMQGQRQSVVYPLIEMEWVKGVTLIDYIDELCQKRDQARLKELGERWIDLLWTLRQAHISHGDLAGGNVMVREDGRLVLVDYDGVYIPEFTSAGLPPVVAGQPDYQHSQMHLRPFNEYTDDFSALVIYVAILSLQAQPQIWDKYTQRSAEGKLMNANILFLQQDFVDPDRSILINDLEHTSDERTRKVLHALKTACKLPVDQVRFPDEFLDPDAPNKEALALLVQAIQSNDDEQIIARWTPALQHYTPAQQYASRVLQARQMLEALGNFRAALTSRSAQQIVAAYDATLLDSSSRLTLQERQSLALAQNFVQAYQNDDDVALVNASDEIQDLANPHLFTFSPQELQRVDLARQRKKSLFKFLLAIKSQRPGQIVASYDAAMLDNSKSVTNDDRELLRVASEFVRASNEEDDAALVTCVDEIQNFSYRTRLTFSTQELNAIEEARQRKMALMKLLSAISSKKMQQIATAYDGILDNSKRVSAETRKLVRLAKDFIIASHKEDDQALVSLYNDIQTHYRKNFVFSNKEQQRFTLARQRVEALEKFRQALASKQAKRIIADYDIVLDTNKGISAQERTILHLARAFVQAYQADDDQAIVDCIDEFDFTANQNVLVWDEQEQRRIDLALRRKNALINFRMALLSKRADQIVDRYDPILDASNNIIQTEREQLELANNFVQAYRNEDDKALVDAWDEIQNFSYRSSFVFTGQEVQRVELAQKRKIALARLSIALSSKSVQTIITTYDSVLLDSCKNVTREDAERVMLAQQFARALQSNNNRAILSAVNTIKGSAYSHLFIFTASEQQRIEQAQRESPPRGGPAYA